MRNFGLIGYPLTHSFSPAYFKAKFRQLELETTHTYTLFPIQSLTEFRQLVISKAISGLNVTIPYKESIINYLDELDASAVSIGSVNVVKVFENKLIGYNTDYIGFEQSLVPLLRPEIKNALILGSGGSSKAVRYVLNKLDISSQIVSRSLENGSQISYHDLNEEIMSKHLLVINTTPLGMSPDLDTCPSIPYEYVTARHILYDLVYNPIETLFLKKGKQAGSTIKNGSEMLEIQAEKSWEIWQHLS